MPQGRTCRTHSLRLKLNITQVEIRGFQHLPGPSQVLPRTTGKK